eukprot:2158944-Pyramimonas_sp.AAC.1
MSASAELCERARAGDLKRVIQLVGTGVDVNCKDHNGSRSIHVAASNSHVDIVRLLVMHGADVNAVDALTCTPLHIAAKNGDAQMARVLVELGADVQKQELSMGSTALHLATGKADNVAIVKLLVEA